MSPKIDFVTQESAKREDRKLIIGFQIGIWGIVFRIGIYM